MSLLSSIMAHIFRAVAPPATVLDPYFFNVVSLLHLDGTDASTTITDQIGKVWTAFGNAQIDTAQSKFGGASVLFDGSGDYISTPDSDDWHLEIGDFTMECWYRPAAIGTRQFLCGQGNAGATDYRNCFEITAAGLLRYFTGLGFVIDLTGTTTLSVDTWYHLAVTKSGTTWRLFLDGALEASTTNATSIANFSSSFHVGRLGAFNGLYTNGHIDDFRATKGIARYTAPFTPPTEAFPDDGPWTPAALTTRFWVDASDASTITTVSDAVSVWEDKSGNEFDLQQGTAANRPLLVAAAQNGLNGVRFDFLDDEMSTVENFTLTGNPAFSSFMAVKRGATGTIRAGWGNNNTLQGSCPNGSGWAYLNANNFNQAASLAVSTAGIISYTKAAGAVNTTSNLFLNGVPNNGTGHSTGTPNISALPLVMGRLANIAGTYMDADMLEWVIVPSEVNQQVRQRLEGYLAWKWGLQSSLPYDHPFKSAAPTINDSPPWTPYNITTDLWLDAADSSTITEAAGAVSEWRDKSNNNRDASQATGALQPTTGVTALNGLNTLDFDEDYLSTTSFTMSGANLTYFAVAQTDLGAGRERLLDGLSTGRNILQLGGGATDNDRASIWQGTAWISEAGANDTNWNLYTALFDTTDILYKNGTQTASGTAGTSTINGGLRIGSDSTGTTDLLHGGVAEIIAVKTSIASDTAVRQRIEGYLAWKWGLQASLPPGHPHEFAAPTNTS